MDLLERAYYIITNWDAIGNEPYDGNIDPRDYRAVVKEWLDDYNQDQETINDAMSELWALVDRQRNILQPYANKDFALTLDLSHHKKAIEDRNKS